MIVVHPGLEPSDFQARLTEEGRRRLRRSLRLEDAAPILICVGRLEPNKGQHYWLPVLADIRRDWPNACLVFVGEGPDRSIIEKTRLQLNLGDSVRLLGRRDDVPALLDIADVFVSASLTEGFGLAVLEAMAAGKPVVAYSLPALTEFVDDGATGFLVPSVDPEALGAALRKVLAEPGLLAKMGSTAKESAQKFSAKRSAERLEQIYEDVLACRRPR
jgi:glycosyltransferase involved in cell wall biosynthesis